MPMRQFVAFVLLAGVASPGFALNILLTNDDGLTSNVIALHDALVEAGHDVVVSLPCTGQSGMGAAAKFFTPLTPLTQPCLNNAALPDDPGAGPVTKSGPGWGDYYYVNGTPIMAALYGLDVPGLERWGGAPDLVLSGPNEGQNVGGIVNSSGTVSNAQIALARGLAAIALSADANTAGQTAEDGNITANPLSAEVATLSLELVDDLIGTAGDRPLLPAGVALNVNFPKFAAGGSEALSWAFARHGSYNLYTLRFVTDLGNDPVAQSYGLEDYHYPGMTIEPPAAEPTTEQQEDESLVSQTRISVTAMQLGFEQSPAGQQWLRLHLRDTFGR